MKLQLKSVVLIAWFLGAIITCAKGQLFLQNAQLTIEKNALLYVNDSVKVKSSAGKPTVIKNNGRFEIEGNFNLDKNTVVLGAGILNFGGNSYQKLRTNGVALNTVEVANNDSITLGDDLTITENLTLQKGYITLGSNNLYVSDSIKISGGSDSSYIRINGEGKLIAKVDSGSKLFPVGRNPYLPVVITNGGGAEFQIGVHDMVFENPENQLKELKKEVVTETWTIKVNQEVSNVELQFGWDPLQETNDFNRNASHIAWWKQGESNKWNSTGQGSATGSGPYFQSISLTTLKAGNYYFGIGGNGSPLPVELTYFTAKWIASTSLSNQGSQVADRSRNAAVLNWQTALEENNSHFEIQRSFDAINWEQIGRVEGQGTTFSTTDYQFIDEDLQTNIQSLRSSGIWTPNESGQASNIGPEIIYYRLKQIDYDGRFEYSQIRTLKTTGESLHSFEIWPNPNTIQKLNLSIVADYAMYTQQGVLLNTYFNTNQIDITQLPPGVYIIMNDSGIAQKLVRN